MEARIHNVVIPDHSPVSCSMATTENKHSHSIWRINTAHLQDREFLKNVSEQITDFISTNVEIESVENPPPT